MTSEKTVQAVRCTVAVHLAGHRRAAEAVRRWCEDRAALLAGSAITPLVSDPALRDAVPGLDWRSDRGRARLRAHLTAPRSTLFSSAALLGPAYRHTGGRLHADADAGLDALAVALRDSSARVHLSLDSHAATVVHAWTDAVRAGHAVPFDAFAASVVDPSWVPVVEALVAAVGADRVVVHVPHGTDPQAGPDDGTAVARGVLAALLDDLGHEPAADGLHEGPAAGPGADPTRWSDRQLEVALAMLPHLRSHADRTAMREFVTRKVDRGGTPAWPVTPDLAADLAARDAADLARLENLVEVR